MYRRGDGGRHLQGTYHDRDVEELAAINDQVFSMGSDWAYIDLEVGALTEDSIPEVSRLELELATTALSVTTQNFLLLAQDGYYTDTIVHRFERDVGMCLGDVTNKNGKGGHCHPSLSVNGSPYLPETEPFVVSHLPGVVTMMSPGVDKVDSRFLFCTYEAPHVDGRFVGFGRLSSESHKRVEELQTKVFVQASKPIVDLKIVGIGLLSDAPDLDSDDSSSRNNSNSNSNNNKQSGSNTDPSGTTEAA